MTDIISLITAISAIIAIFISIIALIISNKQFTITNRLGQLPFLYIEFIDMEEGIVPNIISTLNGSDKNGKQVNLNIELSNVGLGIAKDICFEYNDNAHDKEYYFAFNNVLVPNKAVTYSFDLTNLSQSKFEGYDFELNVYYKDLFNNAYFLSTRGVYLDFGNNMLKPSLTFVTETHTIKSTQYPRTGKAMKYT